MSDNTEWKLEPIQGAWLIFNGIPVPIPMKDVTPKPKALPAPDKEG